jgi:hypothetical protein
MSDHDGQEYPQRSETGITASACFNMDMICLSLNFDFFMQHLLRHRSRENSTFNITYFSGDYHILYYAYNSSYLYKGISYGYCFISSQ